MNSSPHHLQTTHLASARTAPRGERRELRTDQRLVRSIARIALREARVATPGLSSLSPLARLRTYRDDHAVREFTAPPLTSGARVPVIVAEVGPSWRARATNALTRRGTPGSAKPKSAQSTCIASPGAELRG